MHNVQEILKEWDFFDQAITTHGFTEYHRDYRLNVSFYGADKIEHPVEYLFRGCVEVHYESRVISNLADDTFIDYVRWEEAGYPGGYVWAVNFVEAYPGWRYIEDSPRAAVWADKVGLSMHELVIDTGTFILTLVFHDLSVKSLEQIGENQPVATEDEPTPQ